MRETCEDSRAGNNQKAQPVLVLGSLLGSVRGSVLLADEEQESRERLSIRLLSAGFCVIAGADGADLVAAATTPARWAVVRERSLVLRMRSVAALCRAPGSPRMVLVVPADIRDLGGQELPPGALVVREAVARKPLEQEILDLLNDLDRVNGLRPASLKTGGVPGKRQERCAPATL